MDRIDEVNGELEMHDWKTGRVMVGQKLSSDLQAPLYIYGTKLHFSKPVRSFTFYYLNENKTRTFTRSAEDPNVYICTVNKRQYKINILDGVREIQRVFSQIKKGNFNIPQDTKKMHFTCKMCHLKKQGICEGADLQSWNQAKEGHYAWT
jgi:RecB family exonuclease